MEDGWTRGAHRAHLRLPRRGGGLPDSPARVVGACASCPPGPLGVPQELGALAGCLFLVYPFTWIFNGVIPVP